MSKWTKIIKITEPNSVDIKSAEEAILGKAFIMNLLIHSFFLTFQIKCLYIREKISWYKLLILKIKARMYRLEALGIKIYHFASQFLVVICGHGVTEHPFVIHSKSLLTSKVQSCI